MAHWCQLLELEGGCAFNQQLSALSPTYGRAMRAYKPDESLVSFIPSSGGLGSGNEVEIGNELGRDAYEHNEMDGSTGQHRVPNDHPNKAFALRNLEQDLDVLFDAAVALHNWFKVLAQQYRSDFLTRRIEVVPMHFSHANVEQTISDYRNTLDLSPPGHPDRLAALNNLATALCTRFRQFGQMADLEQAITCQRSALELCSPGHSDRYALLNNLAFALRNRFERSGQMANLDEAIIYYRGVLDLCPPGNPYRHSSLDSLAAALWIRFNRSGQTSDLDQAVTFHYDALGLRPPGHPERHFSLDNLALALKTRFDQSGRMEDLDKAIACQRDALVLNPPGHPERHFCLDNHALALRTRFEQLGQMPDLEQAITYHRDALELRPPGHPWRSTSLSNLALALLAHYNQSGPIADLDQAITYLHDALDLNPPGHPGRQVILNNLAIVLGIRFSQFAQIADMEQAIAYHYESLALNQPGHPECSKILDNLAAALKARFDRLGQMADLEQAIAYHSDSLSLHPPGHPGRDFPLNNLGLALRTRFTQLGHMADLEQAITYYRDALALNPPGRHNRTTTLKNLASAMETRYMRLNDTKDLDEAVELLQSGINDVSDTPAHRYTCATHLIVVLEKHNQPLLMEVYGTALSLLQQALAVYPDVELRHEALAPDHLCPALAMSAAAHAIEQSWPEKAVEMLEQGRALLWSSMRGYRQPVEAVRRVNAALADQFIAASEQLGILATFSQSKSHQLLDRDSNESIKVSEARWARQRQLSLERDEIVQQIRQLDGFEHFLQAVPFNVLQSAAREGPVIVVNVAPQRSDAIIIHRHGAPIVVPLAVDGQNRKKAYAIFLVLAKLLFHQRAKAGFSNLLKKVILKKLEELLVSPVLKKLNALGVPEQSRIWWCPTSALCALPIHAAGDLPNTYISSYTPTLSALIAARTFDDQHPSTTLNGCKSKPSLLAVIHPGHPPKTQDEPDGRLKMVFAECNVIEKAGGVNQVLSVVKANATRQAVLDQLPNHPWTHFACHGRLDTSKPFRSAFELEDDPLSLADLVQARLPNADFAFLAACDSATSGGSSDTPDESLHLAAAVQFCGVRSVVGTLWPMVDEDGPRVAQVFYRHMFRENDSRKSAEALHKVIKAMRGNTGPWARCKGEGEGLQRWANYIHIGA
ncbi:hypothetical protein HWV62_9695 [Athelia sp. TMB]|nr:hypothetical protein HWV62_9695 [Athelia sp. TMB]